MKRKYIGTEFLKKVKQVFLPLKKSANLRTAIQGCIMLLGCIIHLNSYGQTTAASYCYSASTGTFASISGTGTSQTSGVNSDDKTKTGIAIGFTFMYCGNTYTTLSMSSNGWLSLANSSSTTYDNAKANIPSAGFLMPFWEDLTGSSSGSAYTQLSGTSPNQVFTAEWTAFPDVGGTGTGTFQVKLYQATNVVQFVYGSSSYSGRTGSIGIAHSTSDYLSLNNSSGSATASSSTFTTGITTAPSNGTVYNFLPKPNVSNFTAPSATSVCAGSGSTITVNSTSLGMALYPTTFTVTYSLSGANSATGNTATLTMGAGTNSGTFTTSALANTGATTVTITGISSSVGTCSSTVSTNNAASITVAAQPSIGSLTSSSATGICVGSTLALTANTVAGGLGTATYTWTGPGISSTAGSSATSPTFTPTAGTGAYSVSLAYSGPGCNAVTKATAAAYTVAAQPAIGSLTTSTSSPFCSSAMTLTANAVTGGAGTATYTWTGPGISSTAGSTATSPSLTPTPSTGIFSVSLSFAGTGCNTVTKSTASSYTIVAQPVIGSLTSSVSSALCMGMPLTLTANSISGGTGTASYTWTGPGIPSTTSATATSPTFTPIVGTGAYSVSLSYSGDGCATATAATATVYTVSAQPAIASLTTPAPTSFCTSLVPLTANGMTGGAGTATFVWSGPGIANTTGASPSSPTFNPSVSITNAGPYIVSVTYSGDGCMNVVKTTASVYTVSPVPSLANATSSSPGCVGSALNLSANSPLNVTGYTWTGPVAITNSTSATASVPVADLSGSGTYSVVVKNGTGAGCSATYTTNAVIFPLPEIYDIAGGGRYCAGSAGVDIAMDVTDPGIDYTLYKGAVSTGITVSGNGGNISFGTFTAAGTYNVKAMVASVGCTSNMNGTAIVSVDPLPIAYNVTGGGTYCENTGGMPVGLDHSATDINYELYRGTSSTGIVVGGTGGAITFGSQTAAGSYSVAATDLVTGCVNNMNGTPTVVMKAAPIVQNVSGSNTVCADAGGVNVVLDNSQSGINYQLYNSTTPWGAPVAGSGTGSISFGNVAASGTYTATATNTTTGCRSNMTGNAVVVINALPLAYNVTGGGTYCENTGGLPIGAATTETGVDYELYNGAVTTGIIVSGNGSSITFGNQTATGTYSVLATNTTTGCTKAMSNTTTVIMNAAPAVQNVTGGGTYCAGTGGVTISLGNTETGISYQLYNGTNPVLAPAAGTGANISFLSVTADGTYTVKATNNLTSCKSDMSNFATVTTLALPAVQTVTGGGSYCISGNGVEIGGASSETGIDYQLYNGATAVTGALVPGNTGDPISFGLQTDAGTYTVLATNQANGCTRTMNGTATILINPLPIVKTVTGGGSYCAGSGGIQVGIDGSEAGTSYQLYNGSATAGSPVNGNATAFNFGLQTADGTYTVHATSAAGCVNDMAGFATVTTYTLPLVHTVAGGGTRCIDGAGINITLNVADAGINYQLFNGSTAAGTVMPGANALLDFGAVTAAGIYSVSATDAVTGCKSDMSNTATITVNELPVAYIVSGGGHFCAGGNGVHITLSNSQLGLSYDLYNEAGMVATMPGTGGAIDFGLQTAAGAYHVTARNTATSCQNNMSGSVSVVIDPLPSAYFVTGGGNFCTGSSRPEVGLSGSNTGINYQLYNTTGALTTSAGNGLLISYGPQVAGTYTVLATDAATGCTNNMTGSVTVAENALPAAHIVSGSGSYCEGLAGLSVTFDMAETGVAYQLYNGATANGAAVTGTGTPLSFGPLPAGAYSIQATDLITGCKAAMTGTAIITMNPLPAVHSVTGGGAYCAGGTGVHIGIVSETGVDYILYNGTTAGTTITASGTTVDFGTITAAGIYTVHAVNTATGCEANMTGSATVTINQQPIVYAVTGGGAYCAGGSGRSVDLTSSDAGITYQLYLGSAAVGDPVLSTGGALSFGLQTGAGTYSVQASPSLMCATDMSGTAVITTNPLPVVGTLTGGGAYCAGGTGVHIGLATSVTGTEYQLYYGTTASGTAITSTGGAVDFGLRTDAGTYTVLATNIATTCTSNASGSVSISITPVVVPSVTLSSPSGGTVCTGTITAFSASAANGGTAPAYQWLIDGVPAGIDSNGFAYVPDDADVVTIQMTSNATCATPATATASMTMTVATNVTPAVSIVNDRGTEVCIGTSVQFTATPTFAGTSPTYRWMKNGGFVASGLTYTYVPADGDIIYFIENSSLACVTSAEAFSNNIFMTVDSPYSPTVAIVAYPGNVIKEGQNDTLVAYVTNAGPTPTYQWKLNGINLPGATNATYISDTFSNNDSVTCAVTGSGVCGLTSFNSIIITTSLVGVTDVNTSISDIRLLPNPNKGDFMVKGTLGSGATGDVSMELTDMLGQVVYRTTVAAKNGTINEHIVLDKNLANGIYMLSVHAGTVNKVFHMALEQ